jgi:hypothetical protein
MTGIFKRKGNFGQKHKGEAHAKTEAEFGVIHPKPRTIKNYQQTPGARKRQ